MWLDCNGLLAVDFLPLLTIGLTIGLLVAAIAWFKARLSERSVDTDYRNFVDQMHEGYYRSSLDGRQLSANPALVALNGYDSEAELLLAVRDIGSEWYVEPTRRDEFSALLKRDGVVSDFVSEIYRHKTRERVWITESARLVRDGRGKPLHYEGTVREITDTVKKLELESRHRKLIQHLPGALFQACWSCDGRFSLPYRSASFDRLTDMEFAGTEAALSEMLFRLKREDFEHCIDAICQSMTHMQPLEAEFRWSRSADEEVWLAIRAAPEVADDGSLIWHGYLTDVTQKKLREYEIFRRAYFDELTGLVNRSSFVDTLGNALRTLNGNGGWGALFFIDLDNFKTLNDTRGHDAGDRLLQSIAGKLIEGVGDQGSVGRLGGDEFVILLDKLGPDHALAAEEATRVGTSILKLIDQPVDIDGQCFHTSCSIGVRLFGREEIKAEELFKDADIALYSAKNGGRNRLAFHSEVMQLKLNEDASMTEELREAVANSAFELLYQIQAGREGQPVGAEALLRWKHPIKGLVSPDVFIPLAEETGLILPITDFVLEEVFATLERWSTVPKLAGITLAVNISALQFDQSDFVERIQLLSDEHGVEPSRLTLEMTEHVLASDTDKVRAVMRELKAIGVRFSLDDFGTGYSSLAHLRDLPFDELKIDGKFIRNVEAAGEDQVLVRTIIAMGQALGIDTVGEWVETEAQYNFLLKQGCDVFQGYFFGKPLPAEQFEAVIANRTRPRQDEQPPQRLAG